MPTWVHIATGFLSTILVALIGYWGARLQQRGEDRRKQMELEQAEHARSNAVALREIEHDEQVTQELHNLWEKEREAHQNEVDAHRATWKAYQETVAERDALQHRAKVCEERLQAEQERSRGLEESLSQGTVAQAELVVLKRELATQVQYMGELEERLGMSDFDARR